VSAARRQGAPWAPHPEEDPIDRRGDTVTTRARRVAPPVVLAALVAAGLAGCGGGDSAASPATTAAAGPGPREGYFAQAQSDALNPALAGLNAAATRFERRSGPCDAETQRLFAAGSSPRASIRCRVGLTLAMRDASRDVARAARGIEGDFRPSCDRELRAFVATAARLQTAWQRSLDDWNGYARGDRVDAAGVTRRADRGVAQTRAFLTGDSPIVTLSRACYTLEDLAEAARTTSG
jgi:hypothetical protein